MYFTTWGQWKALYPETRVLSTDTGFIRDYTYDPYGSYDDPNSYYNTGGTYYPLMNHDGRLSKKDIVVGLNLNGTTIAIEKDTMRDRKVYNFAANGQSYTMFYDPYLDVTRSFIARINGEDLTFKYEEGVFIDDQTLTEWSFDGISKIGALQPLQNMDVMWFGWVAFFPDTMLVCDSCV
jgi:hypothetical protein